MNTQEEIESLVRLLREIASMAQEADLTGGLAGAAHRVVSRYNNILDKLVDLGALSNEVFDKLDSNVSFGVLAVEARMLASAVDAAVSASQKDKKGARHGDAGMLVRLAPFVKGSDLAALVRDHQKGGARIDDHVLTALAPFLDSDTLGGLIREHLAESARRDEPVAAPAPEPPPTPKPAPVPVPSFHLATAPTTTNEIIARLGAADVTDDERQALAAKLYEITSGG